MGAEARVYLNLYAEGYAAGMAKANATSREFERTTGTSMRKVAESTKHLNEMQRLGGERMAKYGTVTAALTGQMGNLGIGGDAVAKTLGVANDVMAGGIGIVGGLTLGVGALAAAVGYAISQHKKWNEELEKNQKSVLGLMSKGGIQGLDESLRGFMISSMESDFASQRDKLQAELKDLQATLVQGVAPGDELVNKVLGRDNLETLRGKAAAASVKLAEVLANLEAIKRAREGPDSLSPYSQEWKDALVGPMPPAAQWDGSARGVGAEYGALGGIQGAAGMARLSPYNSDAFGQGVGIRPGAGGGVDAANEIIPFKALSDEMQKSADEARSYFGKFQQYGASAYQAISKEAQKAHNIQGLLHLKLGKLYIAGVKEGVAAWMDAKGQQWAMQGAEEVALAISSIAKHDFAAAAGHGLAAGKFFALSGGASIGASMVRGGGGGGQSETGYSSGMEAATAGTGSGGSASIVSGRGGASSGPMNFYLTINYAGPAVYSQGGIRALGDELLDYFREKHMAGALGVGVA